MVVDVFANICYRNSSGVSAWFQGPLMGEDKNVSKLKMKVRYHSLVMKPFSMYICWVIAFFADKLLH